MERNDDSSRHKYSYPVRHIPPEDDPQACRSLFVGNLEMSITEAELRRSFGKYGIIEAIQIKKRPPRAFAFVHFLTLDMAYRAKVELSDHYMEKYRCTLAYTKPQRSPHIWVGGLGPWTSISQLEKEFDRFGAIKEIEYTKGDIQAYIKYDGLEAAMTAVKKMRGFPLGGPDHRLRIDFAYRPNQSYSSYGEGVDYDKVAFSERKLGSIDEWGRSRTDPGYEHRICSGSRGVNRSMSRSPRRSPDSDSDSGSRRAGPLALSRTLQEVARKCTTIWQGALILRNSLFPAKLHLIDGDMDIVEGLMKDDDGKHQLRISQRLRLDQFKLKEVQKRMLIASSHAIFLGLAGSTTLVLNDDSSVQTRPLGNLVSYLERKEAAGVITLLNHTTEASGVLYSFPPCPFSVKLLTRTCPNLYDDAFREDHLIIVVLRGVTA